MERQKYLGGIIRGGALATILALSTTCSEYGDLPAWISSKYEAGRTKNSIATVVAGVVGQKLYENSNIELEIQKSLYPDATVIGKTTPYSIDTKTDLFFTSSHFKGKNNDQGQLEGKVEKSEFNWNVKQVSNDRYEISRWGLKFNSELELYVKDGNISGTYIRNGPHFDWNIQGTYDNVGNVKIDIDGPINLGITLTGTITPAN